MANQLKDVEEQISDPEVRIMEITQSYQQTKKKKKEEEEEWSILQDLWNSIKHENLCIIGVPEQGEERRKLKMYLKKLRLKTFQT